MELDPQISGLQDRMSFVSFSKQKFGSYANWLTEGNLDHQVLWTISLLVNQYMNTAIKSTGGLAAEQSLAGGLAIESGANDTMSHLLQL